MEVNRSYKDLENLKKKKVGGRNKNKGPSLEEVEREVSDNFTF